MNDMTTNQIAKQTRGLSVTIPGDTQVQAGCPIAQAIAKWFCFPFQNPINEKFRPARFSKGLCCPTYCFCALFIDTGKGRFDPPCYCG